MHCSRLATLVKLLFTWMLTQLSLQWARSMLSSKLNTPLRRKNYKTNSFPLLSPHNWMLKSFHIVAKLCYPEFIWKWDCQYLDHWPELSELSIYTMYYKQKKCHILAWASPSSTGVPEFRNTSQNPVHMALRDPMGRCWTVKKKMLGFFKKFKNGKLHFHNTNTTNQFFISKSYSLWLVHLSSGDPVISNKKPTRWLAILIRTQDGCREASAPRRHLDCQSFPL